ncbi:hypothetical protein GOQ04_17215 [Emticicia sp. ODNR4P]|nr:hypothetical protein [Emticicia sp. ODNR4P]
MKNGKVKLILGVLAALIVANYVTKLFKGKDEAPTSTVKVEGITKPNLEDAKKAYLEKIRKDEPKVKEAIITEANVLYISVVDDGTKRDGLASYFCETLRDANLNQEIKKIKIVKFGSTTDPKKDNAYGVLLGESECL